MTTVPRILWLTADCAPFHRSGVGVAVARRYRALLELGADVRMLVSRRATLGVAPPWLDSRIRWLERGAALPFDPRGFEWVHLQSLSLGALTLELCRRFGLRLACTVHSVVAHEPLEGVTPRARAAWVALQLELWRRAERVIFLSPAEARAGRSLEPGVAAKSIVLPHGLVPRQSPLRSRPDGPMLFVGRYAKSKGLELLERVVPEFVDRHRGGFRFIGGHGDRCGHAVVERLTQRFPSRCRDLGWLGAAQLERHVAEASQVLVPSSYEPFGLVALEAMSLGTPVLAADVGGLSSILAGEAGGRLLRTRAPAVWIERALELAGDPTLHAQLSQRGPIHVRQHFDRETHAARLLEQVYMQPRGGGKQPQPRISSPNRVTLRS
ncbi:MAG: glycosyltransferase family 4 protein [Enhygromyxa sp.]